MRAAKKISRAGANVAFGSRPARFLFPAHFFCPVDLGRQAFGALFQLLYGMAG